VLFPGGPLALRVFEPRYLDMISQCLKDDSGFGICLIREGDEVGQAARTYDIGTLSTISYWHRRPDGLFGITVKGEQRFRILSIEVSASQLIMAEVELLDNEPQLPLAEHHKSLVTLLSGIIEQLDHPYITLSKHYEDAAWVGGRLVELLPLDWAQKQKFLQMNDPLERLDQLMLMLENDYFD
jgi:hypothetical protein